MGGRTAEIGVYRGRSLASVADIIREKEISVTAVDNFQPFPADNAGDRLDHFFKAMREYSLLGHLAIMKGESVSVSYQVAADSLDFVFIDGDHAFESVRADIEAWRPKVKHGGWLGGHDFIEVGVHAAVTQAAFRNLMQADPQSSIWLTRIGKGLCD